MNVPHRHIDELRHEKYDDLPLPIRHFAAAVTLRPELWTNETAVREHFSLMGNRNDYVDTLIAYVNSRLDFFNLWKRRVLGTLPDLPIMPTLNDEDDMSPEQIRTKTLVQRFLQQRDECYNDI